MRKMSQINAKRGMATRLVRSQLLRALPAILSIAFVLSILVLRQVPLPPIAAVPIHDDDDDMTARLQAPEPIAPLVTAPELSASSSRWWRRKLTNPFYWSFDNASDTPRFAREFPCEEGCDNVECAVADRLKRTHCRNQCGSLAVVDDCQSSCAPANASCAPRPCVRPHPRFHFIPERPAYSLAHAAALFGKPAVRILFLGDSTMKEIFQLARCHLGRCEGVTASPVTHFMRFPTRISRVRDKSAAMALAYTAAYSLQPSHGSPAVRVDVAYIQNRYVAADDAEMLRMLCEEADLLLINWALWYPGAGAYYASVMRPALAVLAACARDNGTVVVYANHPAQHFASPSGRFPPAAAGDKRCVPLADAAEDQDVWTRVLGQTVAPQLNLTLVPSAWEDVATASCPTAIALAATTASSAARLHWVPYLDATQALHRFHKPKAGDCTHLLSLPEFGAPLFDGAFLAVLFETSLRARACARQPPAAMFQPMTARSDAATRAQVLANFGALGGYDTGVDFNREYVFALQKRLVPKTVDFSRDNAGLMARYENETKLYGHGG